MKTRNVPRIVIGLALAGLAGWLVASGCASDERVGVGPGVASTQPSAQSKGGAELWSENCMRCHNMRSPTSHSDAEWQVIVRHMRIRAGLTGEEERKITAFLQSAN